MNTDYNEEFEYNIDEVGTWEGDDDDEYQTSLLEIVQNDA